MMPDLPIGHPGFGRAIPCPACGVGARLEALKRMSRLSPEMQGWSFSNTIETSDNRAILAAMRDLAEDPRRFLTLLGPNGRGKTRLLSMLVNECVARGHASVYLVLADFLDDLRETFDPKAEQSYSKLFDAASAAKVLVLDECDRYNPTPWAEEKLFQLVEHRYRNGETMLTAFASNAELDAFPGYIRSRMQDRRCKIFNLGGPDLRLLLDD